MRERSLFSPAVSLLKEIPAILMTPVPMPSLSLARNLFGGNANKPEHLAQRRFLLEGELHIGKSSVFSVEGTEFEYDEDTMIVGELEIGSLVRIKGQYDSDGQRRANSMMVISPIRS